MFKSLQKKTMLSHPTMHVYILAKKIPCQTTLNIQILTKTRSTGPQKLANNYLTIYQILGDKTEKDVQIDPQKRRYGPQT